MDNPSAFPSVCLGDPGHPASNPGMTLRDYFAGQALAGLCANHEWLNNVSRAAESVTGTAAGSAFEFADAMLAKRGQVQA